jgi:TadE-like protein
MLGREDGQALVEAALVLPAVVFLILAALQLTQLQQARVLAESAAFAAARAGIVMNGDPAKMLHAATLAVLPAVGPTDSVAAMAKTLVRFKGEDAVLDRLGLKQVRVSVRNPVAADFAAFGQHLRGEEIDFDDVRPAAAEATLLSLELGFLCELRVPFVNKLLQALWLLARGAGMPEGVSAAALLAAARAGRYYVPVQAFYTMRMQSNPYRKWARP